MALGEAAFATAWAEGRAKTPEEAVAYALEETPEWPARSAGGLLSAREIEVLRFVAEGLTDAQIAERLYLSRHTVGNHLRSVYRKLDARGRAAAVKRAGELGLL